MVTCPVQGPWRRLRLRCGGSATAHRHVAGYKGYGGDGKGYGGTLGGAKGYSLYAAAVMSGPYAAPGASKGGKGQKDGDWVCAECGDMSDGFIKIYNYIFLIEKMIIHLFIFRFVKMFGSMLFVILVQTKVWYGVIRIEEKKLVCDITRKSVWC